MAVKKQSPVSFVREHVKMRLVRAGFSEESACDLVSGMTDKEIQEYLPPVKAQGIGDGKFLKWVIENGPKLREAVETLFSILSLLKAGGDGETEEK